MFYHRLEVILEKCQCTDQAGFRCGIRLEDALVVVETLASRTSEWNLPLWIASLDLRKAFDRIDHTAMVQALREQGVEDPEVALLLDLYAHQVGSANGSRVFDIQRGVKQGDVISSLLFNAALEFVFVRWKARLQSHGWLLHSDHERLINSRYADDILLYAKTLDELVEMLELLHVELSAVGLEMHETKTKILTSCAEHHFHYVDIADMMIEILPSDKAHKYLGRMLSLNPDARDAGEARNHLCAA